MVTSPAAAAALRIVVVGAGQAGGRAALAARDATPEARITLVGDEAWLPYERPALSKDALLGRHDLSALQSAMRERLDGAGIAVQLGRRVVRLDLDQRRLELDGPAGGHLDFDRLVLSTGSRTRLLPGADVLGDRLHYLRTADEAQRLQAALTRSRRVAIVGAGFIGLEVAAAARALGVEAVVIDRADTVLARVFPPAASAVVQALHTGRGVQFRLGAAIERLRRVGDGVAVDVATRDGIESIEADLLVAGIGVHANDQLAREAGLDTADGIVVDRFGATSHPAVHAAGEVVRHPAVGQGGLQRFESWQMAEQQAACAGASAAGRPTPHEAVPWFWSDQFDLNIQALGALPVGAEVVVRGDPAGAHSRIHLDGEGRIVGAVAFNAGRDVAALRRMIAAGRGADRARLADARLAWKDVMAA